jgi:ribosome-binding factor A
MTVEGHRPTHRPERVAEEIRNEVLLLLAGDLKDPRLALAGLDVTEVRVSPNLKQVRVFVRVLGDAREKKLALDGLNIPPDTCGTNCSFGSVCGAHPIFSL